MSRADPLEILVQRSGGYVTTLMLAATTFEMC